MPASLLVLGGVTVGCTVTLLVVLRAVVRSVAPLADELRPATGPPSASAATAELLERADELAARHRGPTIAARSRR